MNKFSKVAETLDAGKTLHKAGLIMEAESIYREILSIDKDNAEVLGLLAIIALQQRDQNLAKKMWRRAIEAKSPPWIFLRNLTNYFQFLVSQGDDKEAVKLLSKTLPDWPAVRVPDPDERNMLMVLANILVKHKSLDAASRLLKSAISAVPTDATFLHALGKVQYHLGDLSSAREYLSLADTALEHQASFQLLDDLHQCAIEEGDREAAHKIKERLAARQPVYINPAMPSQNGSILVLNTVQFGKMRSFQELHFSFNYTSQISRILDKDFHFTSVLPEYQAGREAARKLPKPDLVINNLTNGEFILAGGNLAAISEFSESFGVPVINHPQKAILTTRQKSAELISDLPGVIVPRIKRFSKTGKTMGELIKEIEANFNYPFIRRTLFLQQGMGLLKIEKRGDLANGLNTPEQDDFYISDFIDNRGPTGHYRKLRAAIVGNEIIIVRVDHSPHWVVHGMRKDDEKIAFYRNHPIYLEMDERICSNPDLELGPSVMLSLRQIRNRIPLEIFGIDFDVAPDGRLVFFEANATMNLLSTAHPEVDYPKHAQERLISAFRDYFRQLTHTENK